MNRSSRTIASLALTAAVALAAVAPSVANASSSPSSILTLQTVYNNPNANYIGNTCKFDLSGILDGTPVTTLNQCGITVTFSTTMQKLSVSGSTWGTWNNNPNQVETPTPDVLYSNGAQTLQITFSTPKRIAGFEIEPAAGTGIGFKCGYYDSSGVEMGQPFRQINYGHARLCAAKSLLNPQVSMIWISAQADFALANLRVKL